MERLMALPEMQTLLDHVAESPPAELIRPRWEELVDRMELLQRRVEIGSRDEIARSLVTTVEAASGLLTVCCVLMRKYAPEHELALALSRPPQGDDDG
jgi:hypothetical protein